MRLLAQSSMTIMIEILLFLFFIYYISKLLQKLKFHFYANPYLKECPKFILIVESK